MAYTNINKSSDYFNTKLWTGNSTNSTAITGVGFQPDMVWIKNRSTTDNHAIFDAIRGATYRIASNATTANTQATNSLASFDSDGFTLNDGGDANGSGENIVGWNWKANGAGSSNTNGAITSTVSVNTTSGFSIVQWTGDGTTATIGTGLNAVPKMIITKRLDTGDNWYTYHSSLGNTKYILLEASDAEATSSGAWNNTSPTSSVFTKASATNVSGGSYIAYCFADVQGFSKFGSYTGNGNADGTFIYTGFKPAFIILRGTNNENWIMFDNKRDPINVADDLILPNQNIAAFSATYLDMLSNGFKIRTSAVGGNANGQQYIYMAFGQPVVSTNGVIATAR